MTDILKKQAQINKKQRNTGNEDLTIVNYARPLSELQTSPNYCNVIILTDTKLLAKLQ